MENPGVKYGVIGGLALIVISLVAYFVDPRMMLNSAVQWGSFILYIFFMYKAAADTRAANGGYLDFGGAFKPAFITYALASLLGMLFSYVMFNFIDPGLADIQKEVTMEAMESMSGMLGEEGTEQMMTTLEDQEFGLGLGQAMMGWGFSLIIGAIIAAIIGAIVKRNPPESV